MGLRRGGVRDALPSFTRSQPSPSASVVMNIIYLYVPLW